MLAVSAGKKARSTTDINQAGLVVEKNGRIRPRSHSATRAAKEPPVAVGRPVQLRTEVNKNPAMTRLCSRRSSRGYANQSVRSRCSRRARL